MREYPIVALKVGKKTLNDNDVIKLANKTPSHHTFQSDIARMKPSNWLSDSPSPLRALVTPAFSFIRSSARRISSGVSQLPELAGKSGSMNIARMATKTVSVPSM